MDMLDYIDLDYIELILQDCMLCNFARSVCFRDSAVHETRTRPERDFWNKFPLIYIPCFHPICTPPECEFAAEIASPVACIHKRPASGDGSCFSFYRDRIWAHL